MEITNENYKEAMVSPEPWIRSRAARSAYCTPSDLHALANDVAEIVRITVACNRLTELATLWLLVENSTQFGEWFDAIAMCVVHHPKCDKAIVEFLSTSQDWAVSNYAGSILSQRR